MHKIGETRLVPEKRESYRFTAPVSYGFTAQATLPGSPLFFENTSPFPNFLDRMPLPSLRFFPPPFGHQTYSSSPSFVRPD